MKKDLDPVSIIMANYNHGHYIDEALEGLMSQTYMPAEIIIVDDASTDDSKDRIKLWQQKHPTVIKFFENNKNQGVLPTIRKGLSLAENEHVLFHSADDVLMPECIEKFSHMMAEHPKAAFCCSEPTYFTKDKSDRYVNSVFWSDKPTYLSPDSVALKLNGGWIPGYALLKKTLLQKCGGIIDPFKWNADWFWLLVMSFRHGLCYIPETLALNRQEENSFLNAGLRDLKAMEHFYASLLEELRKPDYADVLPHFSKSAALGAFGESLADYFLKNADAWDAKTIPLVQSNLQAWNHKLNLVQSEKKSRVDFLNRQSKNDFFPLKSLVAQATEYCKSKKYRLVGLVGDKSYVSKTIALWNEPAIQVVEPNFDEKFKDELDVALICSEDHESHYRDLCSEKVPALPMISLWNPNTSNIAPAVLNGLEKVVPLIIYRLQNEGPTDNICIYGAGSHTQALIDIWRSNHGPIISQILTTEKPEKRILKGIPVCAVSDLDTDEVEAIIISSYTYESEMARFAEKHYPNAKIIKVWNH